MISKRKMLKLEIAEANIKNTRKETESYWPELKKGMKIFHEYNEEEIRKQIEEDE